MISIVFPTFNEEDNLKILYDRLCELAHRLSVHQFEFIFIDDGSTDQTATILQNLHKKDSRVKIIHFSRNYGGHAALSAGLSVCRGDCAIALAADLQDPLELVDDLLPVWEQGKKIVWAERKKREGESLGVRIFSQVYYFLVNLLTDVKMPKLGADVFLVDRVVIDALRQMPEKHTSLYMSLAWLGFSQTSIQYIKQPRMSGKSHWGLKKKIKLALDSILSFSDILVRLITAMGFIVALGGFVYAGHVVVKYCFFGVPVQGWSSLMVAILLVGGIQMIMLGVLGEYLWRTFDESRKRPRYIIDYKVGL